VIDRSNLHDPWEPLHRKRAVSDSQSE